MNAQVQTNEPLWRLLIADEVDKFMNTLVPDAQKTVRGLFDTQPSHNMERHQLTNLVSATLETDSVEVVRAFVQYQIGRDEKRRNWRAGDPPFGEQVLKWLDEYRKQAQGLVNKVAHLLEAEPADKKSKVEQVWMMLARRFAGHLERAFVYEKYRAEQERKKGEQR